MNGNEKYFKSMIKVIYNKYLKTCALIGHDTEDKKVSDWLRGGSTLS